MSQPVYEPAIQHLDRWQCDVTLVRVDGEGVYFVLDALCAVLGIHDSRQVQKILDDPNLAPFARKLSVRGGRGPRAMWCLRRQGVGGWMQSIQPNRVRASFRDSLSAFRNDVIMAADQLLFGTVPGTALVVTTPDSFQTALVSHEQRLEQVEEGVDGVTQFALALERRLARRQMRDDPPLETAVEGDLYLACPCCGNRLRLEITEFGARLIPQP